MRTRRRFEIHQIMVQLKWQRCVRNVDRIFRGHNVKVLAVHSHLIAAFPFCTRINTHTYLWV